MITLSRQFYPRYAKHWTSTVASHATA